MAIVRKTEIYGSQRTEDSTILGITVTDYNEADPPASQQVGQSLSIEIEDDPEYDTDEKWLDSLLVDVHDLVLQTVEIRTLADLAENRMERRG